MQDPQARPGTIEGGAEGPMSSESLDSGNLFPVLHAIGASATQAASAVALVRMSNEYFEVYAVFTNLHSAGSCGWQQYEKCHDVATVTYDQQR